MTGCLDELMDKANEMGLDECWDDVSDEDKAGSLFFTDGRIGQNCGQHFTQGFKLEAS